MINQEKSLREQADTTLTNTIESIWSSTDTSGSAQTAITEEQRARIAEDNRIVNLLTAETNARTEADTNLQSAINTLSEDTNNSLEDLSENKVDKITYTEEESAQTDLIGKAYVVTRLNNQDFRYYTQSATQNTLPIRNANGNFYVGTPQLGSEVTNKNYVDNADNLLQDSIDTINSDIDRNVVTTTGFTYNGDNVVSTHTKTNLKTGLETQESHTFNLANQTTAGLMSSEDVKTLSDLQARVGNLESKTTRLWYSGVETPTADDINTFVTNLGYESPFEGIAVVVEMPNGTHHIWHYYEGNIGWRDDGVDTVSLFTSENPGIVLGSTGTAGKIFAESDGTASVIG